MPINIYNLYEQKHTISEIETSSNYNYSLKPEDPPQEENKSPKKKNNMVAGHQKGNLKGRRIRCKPGR
jgi:hypothetical protein